MPEAFISASLAQAGYPAAQQTAHWPECPHCCTQGGLEVSPSCSCTVWEEVCFPTPPAAAEQPCQREEHFHHQPHLLAALPALLQKVKVFISF